LYYTVSGIITLKQVSGLKLLNFSNFSYFNHTETSEWSETTKF